MSEVRTVSANGMEFCYREAGPSDGDVVILLHGFPQSSYEWRAQQRQLAAQGLRTIAPDQRGYSPGARPLGIADYGVSELEDDIVALVDALGIGRFHVAGHDWGAIVAWHLAANHPERVKSATIISVPHPRAFAAALQSDGDQQEKSGYISLFRQEGNVAETMLLGEGGSGEPMREMYAEWNIAPDAIDEYMRILAEPGALTAALNWYRAINFAENGSLGNVTVPTTFIWSTADIALGRTGAEATGEFCTGPYELLVLEGVSHWVPEEAPEAVTEAILARVASVE